MKIKSLAALEATARRRSPGYMDRVLAAAARVDHAAGIYEITPEAWDELRRQQAEPVEKSPCSGCGDKTNIAQVKASPAAIEAILAGE